MVWELSKLCLGPEIFTDTQLDHHNITLSKALYIAFKTSNKKKQTKQKTKQNKPKQNKKTNKNKKPTTTTTTYVSACSWQLWYPGADLEGVPPAYAPLFIAETGVRSLISAETGCLIVCGRPGATAFLPERCLHPLIEKSWIGPWTKWHMYGAWRLHAATNAFPDFSSLNNTYWYGQLQK